MKMRKILMVLGIIIAILVMIVLVHTIRNYRIITDLQNKISQYVDSVNYYIKSIATVKDGTITMEYYRKDNNQVVFLERDLNGTINKIAIYNDGEKTDTFTQTPDTKIAQLNSGTIMSIGIYNHLETENNWQTFLGSMLASVKSTNYNGKDCYIIKGFMSSTSLTFEGAETYIEKDTGLFIKDVEGETITEKEYEFNNVDDSIFVEPDISQYKIQEDN